MLLGLIRFTNASGGTGNFVYPGPAIDMQSPASAGAVNGTTYLYYAQSLDMSEWEIGTGAYTSASGTFARTTVLHNSLGTGAKIDFGNPPQVFVYDTGAQIDTNTAAIAANTAAISKLTNNQLARVYLNSAQNGIALSSFVLVNLDTVSFDPSGIWDATNKRLKPTVAGYYKVTGSASLNWTGAGNQLLVALFKNGSVAIYGTNMNPNGTFGMANGTDLIHFDGTNDYVDLRVFCSGGASRNIDAGSYLTYLHISLEKAD